MITQKDIIKYVSAFSIGDGSIRKNGTNAVYRFAQREDHKDYVQWQYDILSNLTSVNIRYYEPKNSKPQWHIETRQHPIYTKIYNRMYIDNHKVISEHYLKFLDWQYIAIVYMDDGCLAKRYNQQYDRLDYNIILCTESFSYGDNYIFSKAIKEKLDLSFDVVNQTVNGQIRHRLRLNKKQTLSFLDGVKPYILESFQYKVNIERLAPLNKGDDIV